MLQLRSTVIIFPWTDPSNSSTPAPSIALILPCSSTLRAVSALLQRRSGWHPKYHLAHLVLQNMGRGKSLYGVMFVLFTGRGASRGQPRRGRRGSWLPRQRTPSTCNAPRNSSDPHAASSSSNDERSAVSHPLGLACTSQCFILYTVYFNTRACLLLTVHSIADRKGARRAVYSIKYKV